MTKKAKKRIVPQKPSEKNKIPIWVWFAVSGVASIFLVIGLFYLGGQGLGQGNSNIEGVTILPDQERGHVDGEVAYLQDVPAGGTHNPAWQNCGIYEEPVRAENAVHSLEHGAVWIAYQPDLAQDQVDVLQNIVRQERRNRGEPMVLLSPRDDLNDPIVVTAWRVQLRLDEAADERLVDFVQTYQRGPFTPEPGAACVNGVGTPLS
ncbi:MAG: DUF3105 domain-containing protein [Anaerolineae bacterium]|nr:DUF3105 domain-containing protein [Anaerolineae bacterium]